jgi:hypothetical protein
MQLRARQISKAIERRSEAGGGEEAILGAVVYPLVADHGADVVIAELATRRKDPLVASALAYVARLVNLRLTEVFSTGEILAAALDYLGTVGTSTAESSAQTGLRHGHWAWSALFEHAEDLEDEEHFGLVLELVERAPTDDGVLWMIGDGPLAHAVADEARFAEMKRLMEGNPKLARAWRLNEVDWRTERPDITTEDWASVQE